MASNLVIGGILVAGVAAVGVGVVVLGDRSTEGAGAETAPVAQSAALSPETGGQTATSPAPEAASAVSEETTAEAAPTPPVTPEMPEEVASIPPRFELVRVESSGSAVVAGAAAADRQVILRLDGEEIASVRTDAAGNFVSLFNVPQTDAPQLLTIETVDEDGTVTKAVDTIIVAPILPVAPEEGRLPDIETASALPSPTIEAEPDQDQPAPLGDVASDAPPRPAPPPRPGTVAAGTAPLPEGGVDAAPSPQSTDRIAVANVAPRLFRAGPSGVTALDTSTDAPPEAVEDLGIDAIAYDEVGDVQLSGRGQVDSEVRVYLNNRPIEVARVDDAGAWSVDLPDVDTGIYTLRIDAVDEAGTVTGRIETPFERTAPELVAAQLRKDGANAITVQPGFTLWAISEGYFGDGVKYVQIFEANRDLIRDPDLIYPGQIFALPEGEEAGDLAAN